MKTRFIATFIFFSFYSFSVCAQSEEDKSNRKSMRDIRKSHSGFEQAQDAGVYIEKIPRYKDFRLAIGGGYARALGERIEGSTPDLDQLSKDLMNGYTIDVDAQYYMRESLGIGLNFNYVGGGAETSGSTSSIIKETKSFIYVGPAFVTRTHFDNFLLIGNIGLGALSYHGKSTAAYSRTDKVNKTVLGANAGIGLEYKKDKLMGAGLKLSYTAGFTKSLNVNGEETKYNDTFNLSNFMITAFLSFRNW